MTWQGRFYELSRETREQLECWEVGECNHTQLQAAMDAVSKFLRQHEAEDQPGRDTEMPTV